MSVWSRPAEWSGDSPAVHTFSAASASRIVLGMFHVSLKCRKMSFDHRRASARGRVWSHTFNYVPTTGRVHSWVTLGRLSTISLNGLYTFFCLRIFRSLTKWRNRMKRKLRQSQPLLTWYQYQKRRMCVKRKMSLKQVARHDCRHHQHHRQSNTERRAALVCAPFNSDGLSANCRFCLSVPSANSETTQVLFVLLYHPSWFLLVSAPFANFWISVSSYICD